MWFFAWPVRAKSESGTGDREGLSWLRDTSHLFQGRELVNEVEGGAEIQGRHGTKEGAVTRTV